jgi:hypothetical protein
MTAALESAVEEEIDNMDFANLCEEFEALERRVNVQRRHIQQVRLEVDEREMQQSGMKEKNQPLDQLEEVIEDIKRLMLEATQEAVSREGWNKREPTGAARQKKKQGKGPDEQLQEKVWDPGGSQQHGRGSHEQELMIFPAVEYDAGALSAKPTWRDNSVP